MGAEEAGGPLWPEELCRADSYLVVDRAGEVRARARRGPAARTNQRPGSVPAAYRHQGNASDQSTGAADVFISSTFDFAHPHRGTQGGNQGYQLHKQDINRSIRII